VPSSFSPKKLCYGATVSKTGDDLGEARRGTTKRDLSSWFCHPPESHEEAGVFVLPAWLPVPRPAEGEATVWACLPQQPCRCAFRSDASFHIGNAEQAGEEQAQDGGAVASSSRGTTGPGVPGAASRSQKQREAHSWPSTRPEKQAGGGRGGAGRPWRSRHCRDSGQRGGA
jgi:hypothetical protein